MAAPFPNEYNLRTVAESASKSCFVCHRPSTKVLTTVGNKDFFYTCTTHLSDPGFASPVIDAKAQAEQAQREALQKEKELLIKEYDEKIKKKKDAKRGWFGFGPGSSSTGEVETKAKDGTKGQADGEEELEKEKTRKLDALDAKDSTSKGSEEPKQYILHRNFYQMRINRKQEMDRAKRQQERLRDPTFFPAVPKDDIA